MRAATVLDIGTGCADIPLRLVRDGRRAGIDICALGLDINARHLQVALEDVRASRCAPPRVLAAQKITLVRADAFHLPLENNSVDVVVSSLFLHHFRARQIVELLREFDRVARVGFVMNDLTRHNIPLVFFRLLRPIFARSYITRHDGEASLRRAYTPQEMQTIVAKSELEGARVSSHFPFRLSVTRECDTREK